MTGTGMGTRPIDWLRERAGFVNDGRPLLHRLGLASWSLIGMIVLVGLVVYGLAAVSSLVLPLLFAMVFAVVFRPLVTRITRLGLRPAAAAGLMVVGLLAVCGGVVVMTINGVVDQSDRITTEVDDALSQLDVDESAIAEVRKVIEKGASGLGTGFLSSIASGLSAVSGAVVGGFLGVLIFYYLLKDGPGLRRSLVDRASSGRGGRLDGFITETFSVLRRYWLGRSIVSAVVTAVVGVSSVVMGVPLVGTIVVVTFVGGYIPYVGAVVGGALAVIVALGSEGFTAALIMLAVVLAANLLVENMVDPIITGKTLQVHPLVVLLATTLGGTLAGIPGMIMAVPLTVIADRALPLLMRVIDTDPDGPAAQPH